MTTACSAVLRLETLAEDTAFEDVEDVTVELVVLEDVEEVDLEEVAEVVLDTAEDAGVEDGVLEDVEDAGADAVEEVLYPALAEVYPAFDDGAAMDEQDASEVAPDVTLAVF